MWLEREISRRTRQRRDAAQRGAARRVLGNNAHGLRLDGPTVEVCGMIILVLVRIVQLLQRFRVQRVVLVNVRSGRVLDARHLQRITCSPGNARALARRQAGTHSYNAGGGAQCAKGEARGAWRVVRGAYP